MRGVGSGVGVVIRGCVPGIGLSGGMIELTISSGRVGDVHVSSYVIVVVFVCCSTGGVIGVGATTLAMPFMTRKLFMTSKKILGLPLASISAYVFITES